MKRITVAVALLAFSTVAGLLLAARGIPAQERAATQAKDLEPPLSNTHLAVHTLLREDIFAGFLEGDMTRYARGEKNIDLLLDQRPDQKGNLLAWKGGAMLYRAVLAYEKRGNGDFEQLYRNAQELLAQAATFKSGSEGVPAITGGSYGLFADRLPKAKRAAAWKLAYDAYHTLMTQQDAHLDKLPVHFRGEVLGGFAKSAARTGHAQESAKALDRMLVVMRDTPYEAAARKWKENPKSASSTAITCISCHDAGRLEARLASLK